jgi:hypothetical protein
LGGGATSAAFNAKVQRTQSRREECGIGRPMLCLPETRRADGCHSWLAQQWPPDPPPQSRPAGEAYFRVANHLTRRTSEQVAQQSARILSNGPPRQAPCRAIPPLIAASKRFATTRLSPNSARLYRPINSHPPKQRRSLRDLEQSSTGEDRPMINAVKPQPLGAGPPDPPTNPPSTNLPKSAHRDRKNGSP